MIPTSDAGKMNYDKPNTSPMSSVMKRLPGTTAGVFVQIMLLCSIVLLPLLILYFTHTTSSLQQPGAISSGSHFDIWSSSLATLGLGLDSLSLPPRQAASIAAAPLAAVECSDTTGSSSSSSSRQEAAEGGRRDDGLQFPQRLTWDPLPEKYLVPTCINGRATNRIMCIQNYMVAAALLRRTLIFPMTDFCPVYNEALPIHLAVDPFHLRNCLGEEAVVTLDEFLQRENETRVRVGQLVGCTPKALQMLKPCRLGASNASVLELPAESVTLKVNPLVAMSPAEFLAKVSAFQDTRVLSLGDLFYLQLSGLLPHSFGNLLTLDANDSGRRNEAAVARAAARGLVPPFASLFETECRFLTRPATEILQAAQDFVRQLMGAWYAAAHIRRTDLHHYCLVKGCVYRPTRQVAECIAAHLTQSGLTTLFLATDAGEKEVELMRRLLQARGVTVVRAQTLLEDAVRAKLQKLMPSGKGLLALALLDKLVAAGSQQFLYSNSSSFSLHIREMRASMGTASCLDVMICKEAVEERVVFTVD